MEQAAAKKMNDHNSLQRLVIIVKVLPPNRRHVFRYAKSACQILCAVMRLPLGP